MKSNTLIEKQLRKKKSKELVETIIEAKKNEKWKEVAEILTNSTRKRVNLNLDKINKESKENEILVVPGKVLSVGEVNKKFVIAALNFSEKAKEKLLKANCQVLTILDEIKKNKEAKGVTILK